MDDSTDPIETSVLAGLVTTTVNMPYAAATATTSDNTVYTYHGICGSITTDLLLYHKDTGVEITDTSITDMISLGQTENNEAGFP